MAGPFVVGRHETVIGAPPRRVFNYLADMARHEEWNGDEGFRTTIDTGGPPRAGFMLHREKTGVMRGPLIIRGGMGDNPVQVIKTVTITVYDPFCALAFRDQEQLQRPAAQHRPDVLRPPPFDKLRAGGRHAGFHAHRSGAHGSRRIHGPGIRHSRLPGRIRASRGPEARPRPGPRPFSSPYQGEGGNRSERRQYLDRV